MMNGIEDQLIPQEYVIWEGYPTRLILGIKEYFQLFVGTILFSFPVFFMHIGKGEIPLSGYIFLIVFMVLVASFVIGPIFIMRRTVRKTLYAITNMRIIIYESIFEEETFACDISDIDMVEKHTKPNMTGTILFRTKPAESESYGEFIAFYLINNVDDVYRKLFNVMINPDQ